MKKPQLSKIREVANALPGATYIAYPLKMTYGNGIIKPKLAKVKETCKVNHYRRLKHLVAKRDEAGILKYCRRADVSSEAKYVHALANLFTINQPVQI